MKVLFFDPTAKSPYTMNTVRSYAMGASEASLMRVAAALAKEPGYEVAVFQAADQHRAELVVDGVRHVNVDSALAPDVIVHQRTSCFVEGMAEEYPKARHIIWYHDLGHASWLDEEERKGCQGLDVVCVSDFHIGNIGEHVKGGRLHRIYNPVELDNVVARPKVKGRLGFFSSPQKGLTQVLFAFRALKCDRPELELELVVANPGYLPDVVPTDVTFLGQLPHHRALEELSRCEMLFYPQTVFPETMGVVLAEANALGVPVLSHYFGAALEVLEGESSNEVGNAVRDCTNLETVVAATEYLLNPKLDRPTVHADRRFALSNVVSDWKKLLEGGTDAQTPISQQD